jgi:N-acetylglutamate synthase
VVRAVGRVAVDCSDLGRRVSVRYRHEGGGFTDVVGILENCDEATFGVRDRTGKLRVVPRAEAVAAKVVPSAPPRRRR